MKNTLRILRRFSVLIFWCACTIYTLIQFDTGAISLQHGHYIGFVLLGIALIAQLFKHPAGLAVMLLCLFMATLLNASFTPNVHTFHMFKRYVSFSHYFLGLMVLHIILNYKEIPDAFRLMGFGPEEKS